jgi:hypothetical protein
MNSLHGTKLSALFGTWSPVPQLLCHQAAWWACVLWMGWLGPAIMLVFLFVHMGAVRGEWRRELTLIAISTGVGVALDNTLAMTGAVTYVGGHLIGYCPLWLAAIWAGFGATLRYSQKLFVQTRYHALATGFVGGPLAYLGGEKLERLTIHGLSGWLAVSVLWGAALLILYRCATPTERSA